MEIPLHFCIRLWAAQSQTVDWSLSKDPILHSQLDVRGGHSSHA